jgi:outer membrane receptor for ferrienterochelin and colicins
VDQPNHDENAGEFDNSVTMVMNVFSILHLGWDFQNHKHSVDITMFPRFVLVVGMLLLTAQLPPELLAAVVTGEVRDANNNRSLAGANVVLEGTNFGHSTDLDGQFELDNLPSGSYTLTVSHLGYRAYSETVSLTDGSSLVNLAIPLYSDAVELDQVVYTATRTMRQLKDVPLTTELVTRREIEETGALNAAEALESEIGIEVREDFSGQGVMLQGVDPERVLILVDGNRVIGRVNGSIDLNQLSTQGVKQIEVVKGALSTLYGSEAIGGVINIITEDPVHPLRITAEMTGGGWVPNDDSDHDSSIPATTYSPSIEVQARHGSVGLQAGARYEETGLIDVNPGTEHTDGSPGADKLSGHGKLTFDANDATRFIVTGRYLTEDLNWIEDAGFTSVSVQFDDEETNSRTDLSAEARMQPDWAELLSFKVYRSDNDHIWEKFTQGASRFRKDVSESGETYTEFSSQLTRYFTARHRFTSGADLYFWDISSHTELGETSTDFQGELTAWDAYLQDEWTVRDDVTLVPGVRIEQHEVYGTHYSPKLSSMWAIRDDLRLRASVGQGYRAPTSKELYFTFNHASAGYIVIGNEDLEPETSTSLNLSLEHIYSDRSTSRISVFHNDLRNLIDFDSLTVTEDFYVGIYQYGNIVSAYTQGVEVEHTNKIADDFTLGLAYSFLKSYNRGTDAELLRRPKHSARMILRWARGPWNALLRGRYTSSMLFQNIYTTDDQSSDEHTNPYTLWNVSVGRNLGENMRLMFHLDNIFDTTHPQYGPYRGRVVSATWRYTYE